MKTLLLLLVSCLTVRAAIPPPNTYDWEANGWRDTAITLGSTGASAATYVDMTRFAQLAKQWGLRDRIIRLNLYAGDDLLSCLCPLFYEAVGGSSDTAFSFVAGDYTEATGLTGDITSKRVGLNNLQFGAAPFTGRNDIHFGVYNRTDGTSPGYALATQDGTTQVGVLLKYTDGNTYFRIGNLATYIQTNETSVLGFYVGNRISDTDCRLYKNGAEVTSYSPGVTDLPVVGIVAHAVSISGVVGSWTARTSAGYTAGHSMTTTQLVNYNTLVQWFQWRRGRAV